MCEILAFTSGKGSTGKTSVATNTAAALAKKGRTVTLLEVKRSGSSIRGMRDFCTLNDFLLGCCSEDDLVFAYATNFNVIVTGAPVVSTDDRMIRLGGLSQELESLDYLIIDAPKGVSDQLEPIVRAASDVFTVVTPEQIASTDAMSFVQDLSRYTDGKQIFLVLNKAPFDEMAEIICNRIEHDFTQILGIPVISIGFVSEDQPGANDRDARLPLGVLAPESESASGILRLASVIDDSHMQQLGDKGVESLLRKLMSVMPGGRRTLLADLTDECGHDYPSGSQDEVELFRDIIMEAWDCNDRDSLDFRNLYEIVRQVMEISRTHKDSTVYFPAPRL
jgi:MinD-like ATPase involved in chromosome partitioning or flagellar assembly